MLSEWNPSRQILCRRAVLNCWERNHLTRDHPDPTPNPPRLPPSSCERSILTSIWHRSTCWEGPFRFAAKCHLGQYSHRQPYLMISEPEVRHKKVQRTYCQGVVRVGSTVTWSYQETPVCSQFCLFAIFGGFVRNFGWVFALLFEVRLIDN